MAVYDILGRKVLDFGTSGANEERTEFINSLTSGVYFACMQSSNTRWVHKFTVIR